MLPSSRKIVRKNFISTVLSLLYDFLSLKNDSVPDSIRIRIRTYLGLPDPHPDPLVRYGSEDSHPHPDPYQYVMDTQHWCDSGIPENYYGDHQYHGFKEPRTSHLDRCVPTLCDGGWHYIRIGRVGTVDAGHT
jgi:hypothetical protein